jgi:hypothetical protein
MLLSQQQQQTAAELMQHALFMSQFQKPQLLALLFQFFQKLNIQKVIFSIYPLWN